MGYLDSDGTNLTKTELLAKTSVVTTDEYRVFNADIQQAYAPEGQKGESLRRVAFRQGQVVKTADIDALFIAPVFSSITPASGPAAGGTKVTIKGSNLSGNQSVSIGGVAATGVVVVNDQTIVCTTGAHAAGAVNVVITDDAGSVTGTGAFTYV